MIDEKWTVEELSEQIDDCRYERKLLLRKIRKECRELTGDEEKELEQMDLWLEETVELLIRLQESNK